MKDSILQWTIFLFIIILLTANTNAQWSQTGPYGGWVNDLCISGGKIYAASKGGVLESNNGMDWTHSSWGLMDGDIRSVVVTNTKIFAGTWGHGLYTRDINGLIWQQSSLPNGLSVQCLAKIGENVFAGTYSQGVYLTTNNGATWNQVNNGLTASQIQCFAVSGNNIFCGVEGAGVFLSTNNGSNWTSVNTGLPSTSPMSLAINGNDLYVGLWAKGIYYSPNNGQGWIFYGNPVNYPSSFAFNGSDIYVCGSVNGIYRTTNNGTAWTKLSNGISSTSQIKKISFIGNNLVVGESTVSEDSKGLYYSANFGADWTLINWALPKFFVNAIGIAGSDISIASCAGMYRSTDNGVNWVKRTIHTSHEWADFTALSFRNSTTGFAGDINGYVYTSTNGGVDWWNPLPPNGAAVQIADGASVTSFAYISTYLFAATKPFKSGVAGGVYFSSDNGANWIRRSTGLPTLADTNTNVTSLTVLGTNLFASTGHGVYKSADNGVSWTQAGLMWRNVTSLAVKGTELFAGTSQGVFRSNDNGNNWSHSLQDKWITAIAVIDTNVFAGTLAQGVYWMFNPDSSWKNRGLSGTNITGFAANNGYLFAATNGNSVWKSQINLLTPVDDIKYNLPEEFHLSQNYPNPFNPSTNIQYVISSMQFVSLKVYDILGKEIAVLVNEEKSAGKYEVEFNATGLTTGIYFYRIQAGNFTETRKMIYLR